MDELILPAFYYPTTVMLIDDSESFLTTLTCELNADIPYNCFTNPLKAMQFLKNYYINFPPSKFIQLDNDNITNWLGHSGSVNTKVDFTSLKSLIYDSKRFNEPSVIIIDFAMPQMTGGAFCEAIKNIPSKKILLTGAASLETVVELFNNGVIDMYFLKEPGVNEKVNQAIRKFQYLYFKDKTSDILASLSAKVDFSFNDPLFKQAFQKICNENKIVEYYILSDTGNCLLLQEDGSHWLLIVASENDLNDHLEYARDQEVVSSILLAMEEGKKMPYFSSSKKYLCAEPEDWESYLYPVSHIVDGKTKYYLALIKEDINDQEDKNLICSFKNYTDNEWPHSY